MKDISDEKLDLILKRIAIDSALSKDAVDEISDSPQLLWKVRRSIAEQKAVSKKSWLAKLTWGIPAFASLLLLIGIGVFWSLSFDKTQNVAETKAVEVISPETKVSDEKFAAPENEIEIAPNNDPGEFNKSLEIVEKRLTRKSADKSVELPRIAKAAPKSPEVSSKTSKKEQIKTDFIALSYSSEAESGQILNVKVPRSMMVALGVTSNVENISELVNAEVVMGDDGLARAIRFVQEN